MLSSLKALIGIDWQSIIIIDDICKLVKPQKGLKDPGNRKGDPERFRAMFENHRKSLIQHCERSELRLHFEWTKVN